MLYSLRRLFYEWPGNGSTGVEIFIFSGDALLRIFYDICQFAKRGDFMIMNITGNSVLKKNYL